MWIGWTNAQRTQQLNLLVQLRRYLLLHEAGTRPNLASEALAAATRALPGLWQASFSCEPLLVESFSDIAQIQRFSWRLLGSQRAALGFRRKPGKATFRMPGYSVYRDVLIALDLDAFAQMLSAWLSDHRGSLPAALALDGKMIRDTIGVLSVVDVRNRWAGVENRLHWRKDACLREDATRSRNANRVGALALLRNALFAIHQPHHESYGGLNGFTEAVAANVSFAYRLITRPL